MQPKAGVMLVVVVLMLLAQGASCQATGKITEVRVYRGQALVTREVPFEAKGGPQEVVVSGLPEQVVPGSLYATGNESVSIRAVRYRTTATEAEPRPEVRALDDQIKQLQQELARIASETTVCEQRAKYLDELQLFVGGKARENLERGALDAMVLQDTTKFIFAERKSIAEEKLKLSHEQQKAQDTLEVLQRKRAALAGGENLTLREAVVFVDAAKPGAARFALNYLVNGVGWTPAYSARLADGRDRLVLEYHAIVTQMSGEDWPDVKLTLSTTRPDMSADAPILSPLRVALVAAGQRAEEEPAADKAQAYVGKRRALAQQMRGQPGPQGEVGPAGPGAPAGGAGAGVPATEDRGIEEKSLAANLLAAQIQNLELTAPDEVVRMSRVIQTAETEGLAVDYPIPGTISIQSRRDQQMFHIATLNLVAKPSYTAVPLLTDYVFQVVESANTSQFPLLAGPYNAYVGNNFAGRGELALVALGQNLTVGFGTETRLRASRELVDKSTTVRGGNKLVKYTYRIRLRNFMDQPATVRVWDRLPQAPNDQVSITLVDPGKPLSEDPLYVAQQKPRGLLRWDVEVPANAQGATSFELTYSFQIEFDKNYDIGELPSAAAEEMRKEISVLREMQFGGAAAQ